MAGILTLLMRKPPRKLFRSWRIQPTRLATAEEEHAAPMAMDSDVDAMLVSVKRSRKDRPCCRPGLRPGGYEKTL